jgi:DNA-binding SARP family transcriptional activator
MTRKQVLKVTTLGGFAIRVRGVPLAFGRKTPLRPLALLKYLAARGAGEVADAAVAEALWPGKGARSLRTLAINLHRLRRLVDCDAIVIHREGRIAIDPRHVWCDAASFERMLDLAERSESDDERIRLTERALALYGGDFLPGERREEWIVAMRERLRERYLGACAALRGRRFESVSDL